MSRLLILLACTSAFMALSASAGNVVCYFLSLTMYRPDNGKFTVDDIDPNLCTHVLYAYVGLQEDGHVYDDFDDSCIGCAHPIKDMKGLKKKNPNLKIIMGMGGWNEGSQKYSAVAADPVMRATMAKSVLEFVQKYGFDGFDLDWEYPCQRGGADEDKANYVTLLGELKSALNAQGYILSAAVSGDIACCKLSYDIPGVAANLDMINVMTYDYHGAFEEWVGHYAPLYASHLDTNGNETLNVASGIQYWLDEGAPPEKINLGLGTYGRTFTLANASNTDLYAPTYGGGDAGPYTRQMGVIGYNEVCEFHADWERVWDDEQKVPHKISGNQWFGYDDEESLKYKVEFANSKNLGGVMIWSLDTDDFKGVCGNGPYPLLKTINQHLK